jgi:pimeloyl-ACP methyl ester carboxylesterase
VTGDTGIELYVEELAGPADRTLLVIHGGPDWDHTYLLEPLCRLAGEHRLLFPDLRRCRTTCAGWT